MRTGKNTLPHLRTSQLTLAKALNLQIPASIYLPGCKVEERRHTWLGSADRNPVYWSIRVRGHGLRSSGRLSHHVCKGAEELDSYGTFLTKLNKDSWKDCKLLDCWVSLAPQWKQRGRVQVAGDINPKRCKYLSGGQDRGKKVNQCVQWLHRRGKTTNVFSKLWRGRFWKCFSKLRLVNGNY